MIKIYKTVILPVVLYGGDIWSFMLTPSVGKTLYAATHSSLHNGEGGIFCQPAYYFLLSCEAC
jgi:hypothetical protein